MLKRIVIIILSTFILMAGCKPKNKVSPTDIPAPSLTPDAEASKSPEDTETTATSNPDAEATDNGELVLPSPFDEGKGVSTMLKLHDHEKDEVIEIVVNEYLYGVLAGEMANDWPEEALKAQAIIARTFMVYHIKENNDNGSDNDYHVSTDEKKAQAFNADDVNDKIKKAVDDTAGQVLLYENDFINGWFHACAGGITALATVGLNYDGEDPPYIQVIEVDESKAIESAKEWSGEFILEDVEEALKTLGHEIGEITDVKFGEMGESGRCKTLFFGELEVNCAALRIALDPTVFRSTLIDDIKWQESKLKISGRGFGHGVGMSQWGAYTMAEDGKSAEEILDFFYKDVELKAAW